MPQKDSAEKAVRDIRRRDGSRKPSAQKKRDGLRFCEHPALLNWISIIGHCLLVFPLRPHSPPRSARA